MRKIMVAVIVVVVEEEGIAGAITITIATVTGIAITITRIVIETGPKVPHGIEIVTINDGEHPLRLVAPVHLLRPLHPFRRMLPCMDPSTPLQCTARKTHISNNNQLPQL